MACTALTRYLLPRFLTPSIGVPVPWLRGQSRLLSGCYCRCAPGRMAFVMADSGRDGHWTGCAHDGGVMLMLAGVPTGSIHDWRSRPLSLPPMTGHRPSSPQNSSPICPPSSHSKLAAIYSSESGWTRFMIPAPAVALLCS